MECFGHETQSDSLNRRMLVRHQNKTDFVSFFRTTVGNKIIQALEIIRVKKLISNAVL